MIPTQQDLDDILDTALYGTTWAVLTDIDFPAATMKLPDGAAFSEALKYGGRVRVQDYEYPEEYNGWVDYATLRAGFDRYQKEHGEIADVTDVDAGIADCVLQYGLFNELVFG